MKNQTFAVLGVTMILIVMSSLVPPVPVNADPPNPTPDKDEGKYWEKHVDEHCRKTEECEKPLVCDKNPRFHDELTCICPPDKSQHCTCSDYHKYWQGKRCVSRANSPCNPYEGEDSCVYGAKCIAKVPINKLGQTDVQTPSGTCECIDPSKYNSKVGICNLASAFKNSASVVMFSLIPFVTFGIFSML